MKTFMKTFTVAAIILVFFGCEPEEDTVPLVNNQSFTESELMDLIDQSDFADPNARYRPAVSFESVFDPISNAPDLNEVGKSILLRYHKGVVFALKSNQTPKHTFTNWLVIFNNPENCLTPGACSDVDFANAEAVGIEVIYGSGGIVGGNGIGVTAGSLKEGVTEGSMREIFFNLAPIGLVDSEKAEIHLIPRSHGPKIPGLVQAQISTYEGGCDDPFGTPPFTYIPVNSGECADIQFSVHQP